MGGRAGFAPHSPSLLLRRAWEQVHTGQRLEVQTDSDFWLAPRLRRQQGGTRTFWQQLGSRAQRLTGGMYAKPTVQQAAPMSTSAAQVHPEADAYNNSHVPLLFRMEDIQRLPPVVLMASRGDLTVPSVQTQEMAGIMEACGVQTASHIFETLTHIDFVSAWLGHDKDGFQHELLQHLRQ